MNDMNYMVYMLFSSFVNQAIINKEKEWQQLPQDQKEALDNMLKAIHDLFENRQKILPQYQKQAMEAMALKVASEMRSNNGGYPR